MNLVVAFIFAPLLLSVINRTKSLFAGRNGPPLLQPYFDLWKLLRKGAVYSQTATWVFRAGPVVGLAVVLVAILLVPFGGQAAPISFPGDLVLFAYLLGIMRFFTVLAALDTGSSFEGMGASREVTFSALAEPALLLGLAAIAHETGSLSLSGMCGELGFSSWLATPAPLALVSAAFFIVFLSENSRIPVDDPNTHLELTMIHEVMVLDHSGPDLAFIHYAAALKLWVLGALLIDITLPVHGENAWGHLGLAMAGMIGLAMLVGVVESSMARLRLIAVPSLLLGATCFSLVALILGVWS